MQAGERDRGVYASAAPRCGARRSSPHRRAAAPRHDHSLSRQLLRQHLRHMGRSRDPEHQGAAVPAALDSLHHGVPPAWQGAPASAMPQLDIVQLLTVADSRNCNCGLCDRLHRVPCSTALSAIATLHMVRLRTHELVCSLIFSSQSHDIEACRLQPAPRRHAASR